MNRYLQYIAAALLLLAHGLASAGEFSVSPIRLNLSGAARSQLLTISNIGSTPARFLVRSAGWTVTEAGAVELSGDDQLVVFPASFVVAPKASQNIRVGTDQTATNTEQTWRIVLEELPNPDAPSGAGTTINVLSVLSVPVFMPPLAARKSMDLTLQSATGVTATVVISNTGNAHEMVSAVSVTAMRGEEVAAQAQQEGWYLLPGKRRVLSIKTDKKSWCAPDITRFELRASDRDGQTLAQQKVDAREVCR